MQFLLLRGREIIPHLQAIAQLRIDVFSEFPYLYDGTLAYEMDYLQAYVASLNSLIVIAQDGNRVVGASTALPLLDADPAFHAPFLQHGIALTDVYYFGESVLLPQYRGQKIGHRFFDEREANAAALHFPITAFCAVVRPSNHPQRPKNYLPHDIFWGNRGYSKADGFSCEYHWKDSDCAAETDKLMQFWLKTAIGTSQ
jgi:hypothetical protein